MNVNPRHPSLSHFCRLTAFVHQETNISQFTASDPLHDKQVCKAKSKTAGTKRKQAWQCAWGGRGVGLSRFERLRGNRLSWSERAACTQFVVLWAGRTAKGSSVSAPLPRYILGK